MFSYSCVQLMNGEGIEVVKALDVAEGVKVVKVVKGIKVV